MARNINSIQPVSTQGPVGSVRSVRKVQGSPRPTRMIIESFESGELPVYVQHFLATQGGRLPRPPTEANIAAGARKMPLDLVQRAGEVAKEPRKVVYLAIFHLANQDPDKAALLLDRKISRNVQPHVRRALFDAISHEDPSIRFRNLHAVFGDLDPSDHKAFEEAISLAHTILSDDFTAFMVNNATWNAGMREAADANQKQAESNALESAQLARQLQSSQQQTKSENAAHFLNQLLVSASLRARIARLLRRPPTAEKVAWTSGSVASTSPVDAASSSMGVEEVAYTGEDGKTVHAKRLVSVAPSVVAANFSRLTDGLPEPDAAAAGVNLGLGIGGYVNRAIAVR
jgi:hypothetical protein